MTAIAATVNWPEGEKEPTVDPNPIPVPVNDRDAVITWSCGVNVSSLEISGLSTPEFSAAGSGGFVTSFSVTDSNSDTRVYSYTVGATQVTTGQVARHDPKIKNGST
ncbi:MAG: hypothetical protein ABW221_06375 [Vicinamibacteria bacterium]